MKNIKASYKLAILIPMAVLLLTGCGKRKNVVTMAEPDKIIIKDIKDNEERLFAGKTADEFQFLCAGDTVEIKRYGPFDALRYKKYRVFTDEPRLGITNKSLDIAVVRFVKQSMQTNEKQR